MATFAADILSTLSRPPGNGGARNVRETSLNSTDSRRGFSSVLRSVRGGVRRATTREPEDARPVNQTDNGSRAKETKGINSSAQPDRPSVSSQKTERTRTSRKDDQLASDTRTDPESASRSTEVESGPQDQGSLPTSSLMFVSDQPQVVDQTPVQIETEPHLRSDEAGLNMGSQDPLISQESIVSFGTTPEGVGDRSSTNISGVASHLPSTLQSSPSETQTKHNGPAVHGVEQGAEKIVKDGGMAAPGPVGPPPARQEPVPGLPLSPQDPTILPGVRAYVGATSLEGKVIVAKDEAPKHEGKPVDRSVPIQAGRPLYALREHEALGVSTEQPSPDGREFYNGGLEQFSEVWSDHNKREVKTGETKIPPMFNVDHPVANGSVTESVAGGGQNQSTSAPVTPTHASFSSHVQPALRAEDMAQSTGIPVMRSVVVNVNQPDLGHVNIRVAMTNEVVHTHFSSDRLEVGQFLINSQDRLQTALQSSGLDMGQFRVDIDRQSGGRSFQQGLSQEQSQSWSQGSHGMGQDIHSDQRDQPRGTLHGLLNVVA